MEGSNKGREILETAGLERDEGQQGYYLYTQDSLLGRQQAAFRDVLEQLIEGNVPTIKMLFPWRFTHPSFQNPCCPPVCSSAGEARPNHSRISPYLKTARSKSASLPNAGLSWDTGAGSPTSLHPSTLTPPAGSSIRLNALLIFPQELPWAKRQLCSSVA